MVNMLTVEKAMEQISLGNYEVESLSDIGNIDSDIKKAIGIMREWQEKKVLGEVHFSYYDQTGKTVTLSTVFITYDVLTNDLDQGFLDYEDYEMKDELDKSYWENVSIQFEDEGVTYHDDILLLIEKGDMEKVHNKANIDYLSSQIKEHFGVTDFVDRLAIALEGRVQPIDSEKELRDLFNDNGEENVFHDSLVELIKMNDNLLDDTKSAEWNVIKMLGWVSFYKTKEGKYFMTNDF